MAEGFKRTGAADVRGQEDDEALSDPIDRLRRMVAREVTDKPFSELSAVTYDHDGAELAGHALLDTLEEQGFTVGDFDAVGALTAAAIPLACAMSHAAASRGEVLDAFVMDFVFPSVKGPSIRGKNVILLDAWLSEKSYIQTSSLVTLTHGDELSLDFSIVRNEGAQVVAIAALVGGVDTAGGTEPTIEAVDATSGERTTLPFIEVFRESDLRADGPAGE